MNRPSSLRKNALGALLGGLAGIVATGPMTVAMIWWHRRLPLHERYPLPPREITMKLARESGLAEHMSAEAKSAATLLAHFGYGGACGAAYGLVSKNLAAPALCKGIAWGLLVWTGSYLGWLPGSGILHAATEHPARRNLLMIGAHVVWGASLGAVTELFQAEAREHGPQPFSAATAEQRDAR